MRNLCVNRLNSCFETVAILFLAAFYLLYVPATILFALFWYVFLFHPGAVGFYPAIRRLGALPGYFHHV